MSKALGSRRRACPEGGGGGRGGGGPDGGKEGQELRKEGEAGPKVGRQSAALGSGIKTQGGGGQHLEVGEDGRDADVSGD